MGTREAWQRLGRLEDRQTKLKKQQEFELVTYLMLVTHYGSHVNGKHLKPSVLVISNSHPSILASTVLRLS